MKHLPNRRVGGPNVTPIEERHPSHPGAFAKCLPGVGAQDNVGCGATLMTQLDWQLHWCHPKFSGRTAMRGFRDDHVVLM